MNLDEAIKAMKLDGVPSEVCKEYRSLIKSKIPNSEKVKEFLRRKWLAREDSSKTLESMKDFYERMRFEEIEFNDYFEIYPQEPEFPLKVLHLITSTQATTLSKFSFFSIVADDLDSLPRLEKSIWGEIAKLKNLKEILINTRCITLADVTEMCTNMPQLQSINFSIDVKSDLPIDSEGFASKFSNTFARIEKFRFEPVGIKDVGNERFMEELTNFSIKNLPQLVLVGSENFFIDMSQSCIEMKKESKLKELKMCASKLEEAARNFDKFPSVTRLEILYPDEKDDPDDRPLSEELMKSLEKFTKLTVLGFDSLMSTVKMVNFLSVSGGKLEHLIFEYSNDNPMIIDLNLIRDMCPKLQILDLHMTDVVLCDSMASFTSLRELEIDFFSVSRTVQLSKLLEPPNLQTVRLSGVQMTRKELKNTISSIEAKKILTQIKSLNLHFTDDVAPRMKKAMECELEKLMKLVLKNGKNAVVEYVFSNAD
ncbi:Hypothetical predicted protein [Cloeon dipterum]|uniref:Uncharacterized protein n=1 Tax=Cloeon dipterum TaxID=197152 RepID=A0A8S1CW49_9INSE|nr:Hypothetical predicted protein [Cloeon dipterum]